jgi:small GTP-binding protein
LDPIDPLLTAAERDLVHAQKKLLEDSRALLRDLVMLPEDLRALEEVARRLDELFLVVIVGEYNAGKSTFINCLLGESLLEVGDLPTTREVHVLTYGEVASSRQVEPGLMHHELPSPLLRDLNIVDTPGTNSMQRREQELTERFVPRADLVLFVTTLMRPYAASEHEFLQLIRDWGKKVLFVVNHVDLAESREHIERVRGYVREQARPTIGDEPPIYAISAREALHRAESADAAGEAGERALGPGNEYGALEEYLTRTLGARERVVLKLRSPLETLRTVHARAKEALAERRRLVEGDRVAMDGILADVDEYEIRMTQELSRYQAQIDNILLQMERRAHRFLDDLVRLGNLLRLRDADVVENRFRNEVISDASARIEEEIQALIDWLVRQNLSAWDRVRETLEARQEALRETARRTRALPAEYVYNREEIFRNLAGPVKRHLDSFDPREEAARVVGAVNEAIGRTFGMEALVVGLGAVLTAAFTSLTIDVTGVIGGTILVIAGLFLLPHRRGRLKREITTRIETLRAELSESIERCFRDQVGRYATQLREVFVPERDAIRAQLETLESAATELASLESRRAELMERIAASAPAAGSDEG